MIADKSEFNAVDIAKFICAIVIFTIHVIPFTPEDGFYYTLNLWFYYCFSRTAVPFFFTAAGFFLYRKTTYNTFSLGPTKRYIAKILKLYLIWTIIYLPLSIRTIKADKLGTAHGILIYIRDFIFQGSYLHLWFYPSLIFAVMIVSFCLSKKVSINKILIVAAVFYAIGLLGQTWFGMIEPLRTKAPELWHAFSIAKSVVVTTRNGLFEGFIFVALGATIAFNGFKISQGKAALLLLLSFFLLFAETYFVLGHRIAKGYDMHISLVPLTYFGFGTIANIRIGSRSNVFKALRILSSLVYCIHLWIVWIISRMLAATGLTRYLICLSLTIAVSYVLMKLSKTKPFRWLSTLYS